MRKGIKSILLTGITAFSVFIVFLFSSIDAKAKSNTSGSINSINVDDRNSNGGNGSTGAASGTIKYSFNSPSSVTSKFAEVYWSSADDVIFFIELTLGDPAAGINGSANYSFTYRSQTYSGTFALSVSSFNQNVLTGKVSLSQGSGSSSDSLTPEQSYMRSTERFASEIADASALAASTKKNVKMEYSTGSALPMNIMRAMTESKNVTLEYTFEFLGYKFKTTITPEAAQKAFKEDIPWYGPYYLASNFPTVVVGPVE